MTLAVGHSTPVFKGTIERLRLADYARALKLQNPIHFDVEAARKAGFRDVVAPPGFVISHTIQPRSVKLGTFGIEEKRALMGEMQFEPLAPICAGDTLTGKSVLTDLQEKPGRDGKPPMEVFVLETTFEDEHGVRVLRIVETLLQRKEVKHA